MKVLDLHCANGHGFEGWFASEDDFRGQLARGLVECPLCGDPSVTKLPSAPRLNLGATRDAPATREAPASGEPGPRQDVVAAPNAQMQAAWMKMVRHVLAHTDDVGERFAEEARRIHYGEAPERGIRGQATLQETEALLEEGIDVLPLPLPKALKEPSH